MLQALFVYKFITFNWCMCVMSIASFRLILLAFIWQAKGSKKNSYQTAVSIHPVRFSLRKHLKHNQRYKSIANKNFNRNAKNRKQ